MSSSINGYDSFVLLADQLEIDSIDYWLRENPFGVVRHLFDRIKFGAKVLARASGATHSTALNHMAEALGFATWHSLNAHLIGISSSPPDSVSLESLTRLSQSLVLLIRSRPDKALSEDQVLAFQEFGTKLAKASGLPLEKLMDTVCSAFCGGKSWMEVNSRTPMNTTVPLYKFEIDNEKHGRFIWSEACDELVDSLDEVYQDSDTPEQVSNAKRWIEDALAHQPGFLEAGLCLAQIYYDEGDLNEALRIVYGYITRTENLIPKGYRGKIEWGFHTNRFYHRLLWLRMSIYHDAQWMRYCLRDARKQLRLNPSDNLGVRYIYPLMLLEAGEYEKAAKAARFPKQDGYEVSLIRAFTRFAVGDRPGFLHNYITALFDVPAMRYLFLDSLPELPERGDLFRTIEPDMETLEQYAWPAYIAVPGLEQACTKILSDPTVIEAEAQLRTCWNGLRHEGLPTDGEFNGWEALNVKLKNSIPLLLAEEFT
ncbi:hypothetical protein [Pseudomonas abietaniphila]|uniref:Tetratricopeptide repeat-containing protein n=1 Tax=Pseudomonas abietaniphila TaxID=89065 RepID=A0A1G8RT74_9PSED|nr:hypothetical protein [Pseudomonas abietaniphila]SDJ20274.1 hypothetical protein SAMN05216605_12352 [Pseudomonas abietaniphila]